jgi:hypothetical protein
VTTIFWILQRQKTHENLDELTNELERLKDWISNTIASNLFRLIEKIRVYLMNSRLFIFENEKLRNHVFYVQQIETCLLLKYVIFRDDIDLLSQIFARVIVLFHESKKFNYQIKTLYMFWLINTSVCIEKLKRTILVHSLMNI